MNKTLLHLSLISHVGPAVIEQLVQTLSYDNLDQLYTWAVRDFQERCNLSERLAQLVVSGLRDHALLHEELQLLEKHGIQWVSIDSPDYPALLRGIHLPPTVLYWQGVLVQEKPIAVIGSRQANAYGQRFIASCIPDLVAAGCTIVSGGALGADTMAHQAALASQGKTIAVIGSGLLKPYPASNKKLFTAISEQGGAVVSAFPLTMQALPGNFPARNRIIAGLSCMTVVVQAAEKSGASITAYFAMEQGREVCAVPGHFDDPLSAGCHKLLAEGAALVTSAEDILMQGGMQVAPRAVKFFPAVLAVPASMPKIDNPIIAACQTPQSFDDLLVILQYDFAHLQDSLIALQLQGLVDQDFMGCWYAL